MKDDFNTLNLTSFKDGATAFFLAAHGGYLDVIPLSLSSTNPCRYCAPAQSSEQGGPAVLQQRLR